jgi:hypothetical protein
MEKTVVIIGSLTCEVCYDLKEALDALEIEYIFINGEDDNTQDYCDIHNVNVFPHIQIVDETNKVIWQESNADLSTILEELR